MSTGTLSQKRVLRSLEERYAAGKLNVNALDSNGLSLLHQFSYDGHMTGMQWALQHGGNPNARSSEGCAAAHYAAASGHLHILQYLQEHTTNCIDLKDNNGTYPLYIAAQEGQLDCLMWLTKYSGLSASEPSNDGMTAVHASAQEGHLDCVRYLIQFARCSAVQRDYTGCTPLHFASAEGHWKIVRWFLEHGAVNGDEVDNTGTAAIHLAAEYDQIKVLKVFVKMRSTLVKQLDGLGRSPLDICIEKDHKECADFLNTWQKQSPGEDRRIKHKTSLKKVRFDECNEAASSASDTSPRSGGNNNNNDYTIENGFMIIPGGLSEDGLKERLRQNREEWQKSNVLDIDLEEKTSKEETGQGRKEKGIKGSRNVRKRSSFKDKNAKYQARSRNVNRGSIGHLLDKLHLKKGLSQEGSAFSLPYRATERGSRPDLIQSVMEADKNAGRAFTRRPSLEFFQDIRSQLNSGRKEANTKIHSDVPVTIFHNGTLGSRDNLNDLKIPHESPKQKPVYFDEIENRPVEKNVPNNAATNPTYSRPVVIDGAERIKKRKEEQSNGRESTRKLSKQPNHEPHPQRKIKLPKGFIGILPKQRPKIPNSEQSKLHKDTDKNNSSSRKKWTFGKHKRNGSLDTAYSKVNNASLPVDVKEHYLIRTLPLPSHGSHGVTRPDAAMFFSNNLVNDYKQESSRWSSVRESVGSFFSSLRSRKREKVYKVQSISDIYGSDESTFEKKEGGKFNLIKSIQLKTKKRKSISLDHLPYFSSAGEEIQVQSNTQSQANAKRLSALQPGYTEPDITKLTSMALDQTLKGRVESVDTVEEEQIPAPKPEESLDFVVSSKQTTGFELEALRINTKADVMETGKALMW